MDPVYFESGAAFRAWLAEHHDQVGELLVGYYKKGAGKPSMTWPESVDEALCYGWIDGVRRRVDDERYTIRFTPRKPGSIWSAVNLKRAGELIERGLMQPPGLKAFDARREDRSRTYAYEQAGGPALGDEFEAIFRANEPAWKFFQAQAPSYRRTAAWWIISAKREDTRRKRLATLIEDSTAGRRLGQLTYGQKQQAQ